MCRTKVTLKFNRSKLVYFVYFTGGPLILKIMQRQQSFIIEHRGMRSLVNKHHVMQTLTPRLSWYQLFYLRGMICLVCLMHVCEITVGRTPYLWELKQGFFQTPIGGLTTQQTCDTPKPQASNGVPVWPAPPVILLHPQYENPGKSLN
jgi:hypothetical protein